MQLLVIQTVNDDVTLPTATLLAAVTELISQMDDQSETVDANTITVSAAYGASNLGTGLLVVSNKRADGRVNEHSLSESVTGTVSSASTDG